jgi:hypothetical protein
MTRILPTAIAIIIAAALAVLGGRAISAQDKYAVQVPGGLAFSEFRGYEDWSAIAISENGGVVAVILRTSNRYAGRFRGNEVKGGLGRSLCFWRERGDNVTLSVSGARAPKTFLRSAARQLRCDVRAIPDS